MAVTEVTRRAIFDWLKDMPWAGRLSEPEFLARLYPTREMPSWDSRLPNADADIRQHRIAYPDDWPDGWLFTDGRFQLLAGPDEVLLRFLAEVVSPVVRGDSTEAARFVSRFNEHLRVDGVELYEAEKISGRPVYSWRPVDAGAQPSTVPVNPGSTEDGRGHVFISYVREDTDRINRLEAALQSAGFSVWRDIKDLWPGDLWQEKIRSAIGAEALAFLPCFSEATASRARSVMFEELTWAAEEYRQRNPDEPWIFPVFLDDVSPPQLDLGAGRSLDSLQWTRLFAGWGEELGRLILALRRLLPDSRSRGHTPSQTERRPQAGDAGRPMGDGFPPVSARFQELAARAREQAVAQTGTGSGAIAVSVALPAASGRTFGRALVLQAIRASQINTFGWPIGVVIESGTHPEWRPVPSDRGVRAEVSAEVDGEPLFDVWEWGADGTFEMAQSLHEDQKGHLDQLWFDTRICRMTETLLFAGGVYGRLGIPQDTAIRVHVSISGLAGRRLTAADRGRGLQHIYRSQEDSTAAEVTVVLSQLGPGPDLPALVARLVDPILELFDFFKLSPSVCGEIVTAFTQGHMA